MITIYNTVLIILPVLISGVVHSWVIKNKLWPRLFIPLDGNLSFRGRRIFGDNKTIRGTLIMVFATALTTGVTYFFIPPTWLNTLSPYHRLPKAFIFGFVIGIGYILGELPNSFIKRQIGIPPGKQITGFLGNLLSITDQADSVVGVCVLLILFYKLPFNLISSILIFGTTTHIIFDIILHRAGVKNCDLLKLDGFATQLGKNTQTGQQQK
jgi:CDP-diglyceride synthetase